MAYSLRSFLWTWNNYPADHIAKLLPLRVASEYVIFGYEEAPKTGTPHLQGYAELKKQTRFNTVKKMLPLCHLEERKGTQADNIAYCSKDKKFVEWGVPRKQGGRSDLDAARQLASSDGMRAVTRVCNYQQILTAEKYLTYNEQPNEEKPFVLWLWGEAGAGKSTEARAFCERCFNGDIYTKSDGTKWWPGYDAHECVILDDFRDAWWPLTDMLRILDKYECRIENKGGYRQLRAKVIVVTCNVPPTMVYRGVPNESQKQLLRRITQIREMK